MKKCSFIFADQLIGDDKKVYRYLKPNNLNQLY